ncbi:hypothetical protein RVD_149 [viral metagenome]
MNSKLERLRIYEALGSINSEVTDIEDELHLSDTKLYGSKGDDDVITKLDLALALGALGADAARVLKSLGSSRIGRENPESFEGIVPFDKRSNRDKWHSLFDEYVNVMRREISTFAVPYDNNGNTSFTTISDLASTVSQLVNVVNTQLTLWTETSVAFSEQYTIDWSSNLRETLSSTINVGGVETPVTSRCVSVIPVVSSRSKTLTSSGYNGTGTVQFLDKMVITVDTGLAMPESANLTSSLFSGSLSRPAGSNNLRHHVSDNFDGANSFVEMDPDVNTLVPGDVGIIRIRKRNAGDTLGIQVIFTLGPTTEQVDLRRSGMNWGSGFAMFKGGSLTFNVQFNANVVVSGPGFNTVTRTYDDELITLENKVTSINNELAQQRIAIANLEGDRNDPAAILGTISSVGFGVGMLFPGEWAIASTLLKVGAFAQVSGSVATMAEHPDPEDIAMGVLSLMGGLGAGTAHSHPIFKALKARFLQPVHEAALGHYNGEYPVQHGRVRTWFKKLAPGLRDGVPNLGISTGFWEKFGGRITKTFPNFNKYPAHAFNTIEYHDPSTGRTKVYLSEFARFDPSITPKYPDGSVQEFRNAEDRRHHAGPDFVPLETFGRQADDSKIGIGWHSFEFDSAGVIDASTWTGDQNDATFKSFVDGKAYALREGLTSLPESHFKGMMDTYQRFAGRYNAWGFNCQDFTRESYELLVNGAMPKWWQEDAWHLHDNAAGIFERPGRDYWIERSLDFAKSNPSEGKFYETHTTYDDVDNLLENFPLPGDHGVRTSSV